MYMVVAKAHYEMVSPLLRSFHTYLWRLERKGVNIYDGDSLRKQFPEIITRENDLNNLFHSVFKTNKQYDFVKFSCYNLPTTYGLRRFLNGLIGNGENEW